ncbi:hypothetical protein GQR58_029850 [Nymphon striatum]|nr:hypothetical protein GQR58_029850 [Nymphon striatum]
MSNWTELIDGVNFGEGPRWHDGELWYSDFYQHSVYRVSESGERTTVVEIDDRPSGLGWMPNGDLLMVAMTSKRLLRFDGTTVTTHADLSEYAPGNCNDMVLDDKGNAYVGHFGFDLEAGADYAPASIVLVRADGSTQVAAEAMAFPNGSVITPDGTTLIVGQSFGGDYIAFDIEPDATLTNRRQWADIPGTAPDGCTLDAGGGICIDRTDPVNELRSSDGNQDWLLAVPFAFAVTDDGFVGVSQGVDQPLPLVVVRSDDGVAWEPVEDGRLDEWPAIPESAGPTGFAVGDDTVHLVRAWAEAGETDEDDERGDVAELNVSTARFDLETQEWTLDTQLDVVELDVSGRSVNTVDVAWSPAGLLVDVSVISNPFGQLISERDPDQAEVCAAFGAADNSVRLRRCGSTEIEQIELPQPAANLRSRATVVIFAPLGDSFTVVRDPSYNSIGDNAPYMFDGGVGLTMQSASSSDDPTGETVDGIEWSNTWGPISRVFTAAARGDERIALDAPTVSRLTPADPIRGLWYSELSAPGDRLHVVVDGETWDEIAGDYAMTPEELTEANPAIELPVTPGVEVTIPDMDTSERNWRSIDLQSAFGSTDISDVRFRTVAAGEAGFVVVATTTPQWQPARS